MNSRLRSRWYLILGPVFTLTAPQTWKMKCIIANPQHSEKDSPLSRAYLLLLSSPSLLQSHPDLCFNALRITTMCSHRQANSFWTLPYLYVLTQMKQKWWLFFFFFCSSASQKTLSKVCCPCCPRRCWGIVILFCCYSCFRKGKIFSKIFSWDFL